jgi:23S rRNA (guanosine2251-2'-O)-methyltransferase
VSEGRVVYGLQPVLEALKAKSPVERIYMARAEGAQTKLVRELAKEAGVKVIGAPKEELDRRSQGAKHQGVVAILDSNEVATTDVGAILARAKELEEDPLVVLLDGIQDPHNLGAILRSAHALGAHGVVIPKNRAVQVTPVVVKASAGAALLIPIAVVTNLRHALDELREAEVWTAAAVMGGQPAQEARLDGPLALVIGGEGEGVRPTLADDCDLQVSIPLGRGFDSLNASVAAGILLYEAVRQRST